MKIKTPKEYERDKRKCRYCGGSGQDIFDKSKPCPNCSMSAIIIKRKK